MAKSQPVAPAKKTAAPKKEAETSGRSTALALAGHHSTAPAIPADLEEAFSGDSGFESMSAKDILIPRLTILQSLSPQLQKTKPADFVEDAAAGMIFDTGTKELLGDSIQVIPCYFSSIYLEWAPRSTGKGLVGNHGTNAAVMKGTKLDDRKRNVLPNGNYIAETAQWMVINISANGRRSFIPLASTQLKASRQWLTRITSEKIRLSSGREVTPPMRYRSWFASPVLTSNSEGEWYLWSFAPGPTIPEMFAQTDGKGAIVRDNAGNPIIADVEGMRQLIDATKAFQELAKAGLVGGQMDEAAEEAAAAETRDAVDRGDLSKM